MNKENIKLREKNLELTEKIQKLESCTDDNDLSMKVTRRQFFGRMAAIGAATAAGYSYTRYIEPRWLEVNHEKLAKGKLHKHQGIKILHLSDFHASSTIPYELINKAIGLGLQENPDIICLTGDYITTKLHNQKNYQKILVQLPKVAPTFACIGNHDGGTWAGKHGGYKDISKVSNLLRSSDIQVLVNQRQNITVKQTKIQIVGLGDLWAEELKAESVLDNKRKDDSPIIVLSHNPDSKDALIHFDWDLMLCGHTHGGQLKIPILGATPFAPVKDHSMVEGLHFWFERYIHITRGVGNVYGMRFNCRPQVSVIIT